MDVRIKTGQARGCATAPPSKSCAQRLLICAALAGRGSVVRNLPAGRDIEAVLDSIGALGTRFTCKGNIVDIHGGIEFPDGAVCPCGESGSALRFLLPVTLLGGRRTVFSCSERLMQRGIGEYEALLPSKGIEITKTGTLITARGRLPSGSYAVSGGVSSQFASGLLLALPFLAEDSTLAVLPPVESRPYIDLTVNALKQFGVTEEEREPDTFWIKGGQTCRPADVTVAGDWSNAAALLAFNAVGGSVSVTGLSQSTLQADRVFPDLLKRLNEPNAQINLSQCPDLGPILFAVAAALGRGARFTGIRRLRFKESDRVAAMIGELSKFGIRAEARENDLRVCPGTLYAPRGSLCAHNDHRIVMALSLLCSVTGGTISEAQAVEKSFPDYFNCLRRLGLAVEEENGAAGD